MTAIFMFFSRNGKRSRKRKTEPDVCRYPLSAPGSDYKYQSDCKKTAYRWRNPKRQYVVFPQQKYSQVSEGE